MGKGEPPFFKNFGQNPKGLVLGLKKIGGRNIGLDNNPGGF